jgi:DNA-binding transcriptional ArsR family regulator
MGAKHAELKAGRIPAHERSRLPEEGPTYPLSNRIRQEALLILHEGEFSAVEIGEMIGEDTSLVTNHLRDLYDAGCIEFAGFRGKGNFKKAVYRAIVRPYTSREEARKMSPEERNEVAGVNLQWTMTEADAAFRKKKMANDENCVIMFDEPRLDREGRVELDEFLVASWSGDFAVLERLKSIQDIAARAANRMAKSGEVGVIVVASLMAFERARSAITVGSSRLPISKS